MGVFIINTSNKSIGTIGLNSGEKQVVESLKPMGFYMIKNASPNTITFRVDSSAQHTNNEPVVVATANADIRLYMYDPVMLEKWSQVNPFLGNIEQYYLVDFGTKAEMTGYTAKCYPAKDEDGWYIKLPQTGVSSEVAGGPMMCRVCLGYINFHFKFPFCTNADLQFYMSQFASSVPKRVDSEGWHTVLSFPTGSRAGGGMSIRELASVIGFDDIIATLPGTNRDSFPVYIYGQTYSRNYSDIPDAYSFGNDICYKFAFPSTADGEGKPEHSIKFLSYGNFIDIENYTYDASTGTAAGPGKGSDIDNVTQFDCDSGPHAFDRSGISYEYTYNNIDGKKIDTKKSLRENLINLGATEVYCEDENSWVYDETLKGWIGQYLIGAIFPYASVMKTSHDTPIAETTTYSYARWKTVSVDGRTVAGNWMVIPWNRIVWHKKAGSDSYQLYYVIYLNDKTSLSRKISDCYLWDYGNNLIDSLPLYTRVVQNNGNSLHDVKNRKFDTSQSWDKWYHNPFQQVSPIILDDFANHISIPCYKLGGDYSLQVPSFKFNFTNFSNGSDLSGQYIFNEDIDFGVGTDGSTKYVNRPKYWGTTPAIYPIVVFDNTNGTLNDDENININYQNGSLTITKTVSGNVINTSSLPVGPFDSVMVYKRTPRMIPQTPLNIAITPSLRNSRDDSSNVIGSKIKTFVHVTSFETEVKLNPRIDIYELPRGYNKTWTLIEDASLYNSNYLRNNEILYKIIKHHDVEKDICIKNVSDHVYYNENKGGVSFGTYSTWKDPANNCSGYVNITTKLTGTCWSIKGISPKWGDDILGYSTIGVGSSWEWWHKYGCRPNETVTAGENPSTKEVSITLYRKNEGEDGGDSPYGHKIDEGWCICKKDKHQNTNNFDTSCYWGSWATTASARYVGKLKTKFHANPGIFYDRIPLFIPGSCVYNVGSSSYDSYSRVYLAIYDHPSNVVEIEKWFTNSYYDMAVADDSSYILWSMPGSGYYSEVILEYENRESRKTQAFAVVVWKNLRLMDFFNRSSNNLKNESWLKPHKYTSNESFAFKRYGYYYGGTHDTAGKNNATAYEWGVHLLPKEESDDLGNPVIKINEEADGNEYSAHFNLNDDQFSISDADSLPRLNEYQSFSWDDGVISLNKPGFEDDSSSSGGSTPGVGGGSSVSPLDPIRPNPDINITPMK